MQRIYRTMCHLAQYGSMCAVRFRYIWFCVPFVPAVCCSLCMCYTLQLLGVADPAFG